MTEIDTVLAQIRPRRKIDGIAAVLLPFDEAGQINRAGFVRQIESILTAGLKPAVNMDTGYVHLLSGEQRLDLLALAAETVAGHAFVAGAFVDGESGDVLDRYRAEVAAIQSRGGTPILFQSSVMLSMSHEALLTLYGRVAAECDRLLIFELGQAFAPFGRIYELELVGELMRIPAIVGLKHSSLERDLEWQRLALRDAVRPEFAIYTGNDLAIDMVTYGSDYLLGLAAFAPEAFAARDALWAAGDAAFYEVNDALQALGSFAFRAPVPAYRHSAAQFLKLRGRIASDAPHPRVPRRPSSDVEVLRYFVGRIESLVNRLRLS